MRNLVTFIVFFRSITIIFWVLIYSHKLGLFIYYLQFFIIMRTNRGEDKIVPICCSYCRSVSSKLAFLLRLFVRRVMLGAPWADTAVIILRKSFPILLQSPEWIVSRGRRPLSCQSPSRIPVLPTLGHFMVRWKATVYLKHETLLPPPTHTLIPLFSLLGET